MEKNQHTINGLMRKRSELAGHAEDLHGKLAKIMADIAAIEASLRLFDPDIKLDDLMPKPLGVDYPSVHGELTKLALTFMRQEAKPIDLADLNERIMKARNIPLTDELLTKKMYWRLHSTMRNHRTKGRVRSLKVGNRTLWELVK